MSTNEVKQVDNWDEEVTDIAPKQVSSWDEEVVDEPVKKKDTTPLPLESKSPKSALDVLSGVNPSAKALLTEQKKDGTTQSKPTAKLDLTAENKKFGDLKVGQEETDKPLFGITKESKAKINEVYNLSKQKESLIDDYARNSMALNAIAKNTAVTDLNNLYLQKQQAIKSGNNQLVANINARIEATRSLPVSQPLDLQSQIRANAEKYSNQPQDFNRPEIPMNPITENQTLERNGFKVAATIGDLHDRYTEASATMQKIQHELERIDSTITDFKKENRVGNYDKYEGDGNVLEGALDVPEAFGRGFGSTAKSIYQGLATVLGDKQDRIDQANRRYVEESILYPTQTKGMLTSGAEMMGGVAPYVVSTAVAPESVLAHVVVNGLSMGASGIGNGYYEMYQKQKQQGATDEQADEFAVKNAKFEGIKETAVGAMLPFMGGIGAKTFLAPAEKSAMKEFLATQGVIIPTFTASKLASNVFQKYGLDQEDVNIGDGLQETVENAIILGGMMEFAHKAPKALKEAYRVNLSGQYPSLEGVINKAVQDGVLDASRAQIFTEKLKKDYVVFNSMPKDITTEQKLAIEPEVKAIIELSKQEPSAIENPEVAKDKIAQLQKVVAEKLGTPLTEKETKSYEKLLGRKKPIESASGEKIVLELLPSEKVELEHYEKRIEKAKENEAKLAKEEEKPVVEQESPIEETKDSGLEEETPSVLSNVKSTAKALEIESKNKPTIWEQVKQFIKDTAKKVGNKLGIISNEQHLSNFEKAKADWDKLSSREKKLKRADYELDDLHHTEGGYYKVGDSLIDLDLNASHLKLLLENNKFLNILNKLGVNKIHGENRPPEEMFAHYSDNKIHLNNNSAFENIRQVTNAMSHELGHHEWTKLTKEERNYVRSLPLETGMAKHYEAQEKNGGKQTSASLQEENFADYVMQYFQGKLYGDEALLNKIPTKLREMFDNKYSDLLKDNEHSEVAEAYHKAKADGTNPELVKAVEDLLGKAPTQYTEAAGGSALKDVEGKKADIERRRQEEISNQIEDAINIRNSKTKDELDKSLMKAFQEETPIKALNTAGMMLGKDITAKYYNKDYSFKNEVADAIESTQKNQVSKINAKYDAELATLEETSGVSGSALKDVESTAKALESKKEEELNKILPERERLSHRIVKDEYTTTADDMTKGGNLIPNDFYQHPEYYADLSDPNYKESWDAIKKIKGNPDAEITIYRSAPNGSAIEEGDWISLSKKYAKQEGEHPTDESQDLPVISIKVKAKEIVWDGNDINEFAYYPEKSKSKADKISEAYHKAKADGSNPELVKAVESILSKETPTTETKIAEEAPKAEPIAPKENIFEIHEKTKGAPKKDKVIEQYAKENPKQIDRVREIIDNFDTLKQEFIKQIEQKEIRNFKIEC